MNEPSIRRLQAFAWGGFALAVAVLLYILSPVLTPFMLAFILAYLLAPGVDACQRLKMPRWLGVTIMLIFLLAIILGLILVVVPLIRKEVVLIAQQLPGWVGNFNTNVSPFLQHRLGISLEFDGNTVKQMLQEAVSGSDNISSMVMQYLKTGGTAVIALLANLFLTPVVLMYLLFDWHKLLQRLSELIPRRWHETTTSIVSEIDQLLASFLRGQIVVMFILAVYYSVGLAIAGFDSAIPIGAITGLLVFIPYLGFGLGLVLAILSGLLQFDGYYGLLSVAIVFGFGQLLESLYLTPRIVGERIGLHPLVVIFALFAFGDIFGFFGVLMALPLSAVLSVVLRHLYQSYKTSPFYTHS